MFDFRSLKPKVEKSRDWVECPVRGCENQVPRRTRKQLLVDPAFRCPIHRIFVSPSTFEYEDYRDNLLIRDEDDGRLLDAILSVKRETKRLGRECSEDAFTFNAIRTLERESLLEAVLSEISGAKEEAPVPAYWSFSHRDRAQHPLLAQAASAFGESERRGSEPDLIVDTRNTLFIMEAKLGSTNDTTPSRRSVLSDYEAAEGGW